MSDYDHSHGQESHPGNRLYPPPIPQAHTSTKAILSFILGLLSLIFWVFAGVPAIILGAMAHSDIRKNAQRSGSGLATSGVILGCVSVIAAPFFLLIFIPLLTYAPPTNVPPADTERLVHIHLRGPMSEASQGDAFAAFSEGPPSLGSILKKLEKARTDESVKGVIISLDGFTADLAHGEELYGAFRALDESGKKVYIHTEEAFLSTGTYTLLAGASQINAAPTAFINLTGMYTEGLFLKDGLSKLGVEADIVHMGDYKSAGEIVMRSEPSPEAEAAMNWLLDGLYESCVDRIALARGKSPDDVRRLIDGGPYTTERALELGLVDSLLYLDELLDSLRLTYGEEIYIDNHYNEPEPPDIDLNSPLAPLEILFADFSVPPSDYVGESIAIVSVEGTIQPGYSNPDAMSESNGAYSGDIRKALEQAAEDDTVKAVILRVNSPGGSATASEIILRAAMKLKEKKPLVVSMGNLAASGGYYVSCDANAIFANETTITASIGVVGGKIVTTGLWDKLGVNWHPYQRGANADWISTARPFTEPQRVKVLAYMDDTYSTFKNHVVDGRGDKLTKTIDEMAGGRVFTGKQALALGLVDNIGGLQDAIAYTAELVGLEKYDVRPLPDPEYLDEAILHFLFGGGDRPSDLSFSEGQQAKENYPTTSFAPNRNPDPTSVAGILNTLDPQRSQSALQLLECANLLNREGVLAITPQFFTTP